MKITVVQPPYFMGENPDEKIAEFLIRELWKAEKDSLIVLPEYSNAGGISAEIDPSFKYMRPAGFGGGMIRNDDFINDGLCPEVFLK